jgi:hypothetical protein
LRSPSFVLLGGNGGLAVFDGDTNTLTGFKPGVLDPQGGELDSGVKLRWFCSGVKSLDSAKTVEL